MSRRPKPKSAKSRIARISAEPMSVFRPGIGITLFRVGWTVFVVVATSLPHLLIWFSTPSGFHYSWALPPYPEDSFSYAAWAQQAAHGAWLFKIKYTALPHRAFLFNPFFLICGWLSSLSSCDIGLFFWIVKALGVVMFLVTFYRYIDYLGLRPVGSITASVVVGVAAGFGGLLAFFNLFNRGSTRSADLWIPEVTTYWSLLWNPLFPVSLTLMLLSIYWLDRGTREARSGPLWYSGAAIGTLTLIHPYSVPLFITLATVVTIARRRMQAAGMLCRYLAMALPPVIYLALIAKIHPLAAKHSEVGQMASPPLFSYGLGFGLPLLLSIVGLAVDWKKLATHYWHIILWFVLSMVFAYLPFWFQRKLIFGAHVSLSILAGLGVNAIWAKYSTTLLRRWTLIGIAIAVLPLMTTTPIYLFNKQRKEVASNKNGAYFISGDLMEGLQFLKHNTEPDNVVFAGLATSRLIPAFSGNTVVWGHWAMSIDLKRRQAWAAIIFDPNSAWDDEIKSREFWGNDIQFLLADHDIKRWLEDHPPRSQLILRDAKKIFERPSLVIYKRPNDIPSVDRNPN
jgi:hypothetical protein